MAFTLDDFAKQYPNMKKLYNPQTQQAGLTNTATGKSINFGLNQGQQYGLGNVNETGSHVINDVQKLTNSLAGDKPQVQPQVQTQYKSPYDDQIKSMLGQMQTKQFSYNPQNDAGLQQAQNQAMDAASRGFARRGMLVSDANKAMMTQEAAKLEPQYEQMAYNRFQNDQSNLFNQLNTLLSMDNKAYGQYRDAIGDQRYDTEQTKNDTRYREQMQADALGKLGYTNPYSGMNIPGSISNYNGDYSDKIAELKANGAGADEVTQWEAARANKIFGNPELLQKYGQQFKTLSNRQNEIENQRYADETAYTRNMNERKFNEDTRRFDVGQQNWQKEMSFKERQAQIENAVNQGRLSLQQAELQLQKDKFAADNDPNSIDNQMKKAQLNNYLTNGNKAGKVDYEKDPDFASDVAAINQNPEQALDEIKRNAEALIRRYGPDGYKALLQFAQDR